MISVAWFFLQDSSQGKSLVYVSLEVTSQELSPYTIHNEVQRGLKSAKGGVF